MPTTFNVKEILAIKSAVPGAEIIMSDWVVISENKYGTRFHCQVGSEQEGFDKIVEYKEKGYCENFKTVLMCGFYKK